MPIKVYPFFRDVEEKFNVNVSPINEIEFHSAAGLVRLTCSLMNRKQNIQ